MHKNYEWWFMIYHRIYSFHIHKNIYVFEYFMFGISENCLDIDTSIGSCCGIYYITICVCLFRTLFIVETLDVWKLGIISAYSFYCGKMLWN